MPSSWHIEVCIRIFVWLSTVMANHREGSEFFRVCRLAMFLFHCKSRDERFAGNGGNACLFEKTLEVAIRCFFSSNEVKANAIIVAVRFHAILN